jgi:hypothetical protein
MTNPEEVSRMMYEALKDVIGWVPGRVKWHTDAAMQSCEKARAAIQLYEQSITVDLEREEYERGEIESAQSIAYNKGESR